MNEPYIKKYIFISYASENIIFAEWLAKILTREGYFVWIDRYKMLGGEPFPEDIAKAIKQNTFRFLALMSKSSVKKDTPRKERTLANKARKQSGIRDFIIPLLIDDLSIDDLDLLTTDLTTIHFNHNWYSGLKQLVKKLDLINAPKDQSSGLIRLRNLFPKKSDIVGDKENLISNMLFIEDVPKNLVIYKETNRELESSDSDWISYKNGDNYWSFTAPPEKLTASLKLCGKVDWQKNETYLGIITKNIARSLIRKHLIFYCISRGLRKDKESKRIYFPNNYFNKNHLQYNNIEGEKTYIAVHGRCVGGYRKNRDRIYYKYHLAPQFYVDFNRDDKYPIVFIKAEFYFTYENGSKVDNKRAFRFRKKFTRNKFNNFWLSRILAIASWFSNGMDRVRLVETEAGALVINCQPKVFSCDKGINENSLQQGNNIVPFDQFQDHTYEGGYLIEF